MQVVILVNTGFINMNKNIVKCFNQNCSVKHECVRFFPRDKITGNKFIVKTGTEKCYWFWKNKLK